MKKPGGGHKKPKGHVPHKTGGGAKRKGVRASGAPVPAPAKHPQHHPHHPPGHRMTNPLVPAPHHHRHVKPKQPVRRKLALGEGVACCVAEALAASLRLAGGAVSDSDVLALHYLAGGSENGGVAILDALEAASASGLAGARPAGDEIALASRERFERPWAARECPCTRTSDYGADSHTPTWENPLWPLRVPSGPAKSSLVLGVTLPGGPHAVLADGDTWWSWGEPYPRSAFSGAVIEEAWAVQWAA